MCVGDAAPESVFRIASLTKPFTAVATIRAAERAGVGLDTPALDLLPEIRGCWRARQDITIAHLLSQTSGLAATLTSQDIAPHGDSDHALLRAAELTVREGSVREPGERWEYYNGNYFLAGAVTAALTNTSYEQAVDDLVLTPFALAHTSFTPPADMVIGVEAGEPVRRAAYPRGRRPSGGLTSTIGDLLSFTEHIMGDVNLRGVIGTPRTRPNDPMRYGLGWALGPSGQMYLNGRLAGYRSAIVAVPEHHLAACALANDTDALPALAEWLSQVQFTTTGDDLRGAINTFAA